MNSRKATAVLTLLVLAGQLGGRIAWADTDTDTAADAAGAANGSGDALQEVTVVAQKQNIGLQHAPVALTAITGDAMKAAAVVSPLDLNGQVPGLVITQSEGYNRSVSIRGIGFNVPQDDSAQTSVSYHEDGIYVAFPVALNSDFLDVDHVEVLRGPQGTVFGQNSIGGTINVISVLPSFDAIKGYGELAGGSYDLLHASAAVNIPFTGNFAIRAAYDQNYQHGFVTATGVPGYSGGYDLGNQDNLHGRLQALWQTTEDLSILFRAEYAQAREHETEGKNIADPNPDFYQQSSDFPGRLIYNQQLGGVTITYDLPFATLKSIGSYQEVNHHGGVNEDGMDLDITSAVPQPHDVEYFEHNTKNLTEELDLSSKPGGPVDWIIGGFYLKGKTTVAYDQYNLYPGDPTLNGVADPDILGAHPDLNNLADPISSFLLATDVNDATVLGDQLYFQNNGIETRTSSSEYGQAIWHATDSLRLTLGGRYTRDHNTTFFSDYYNLFAPATFVQQTATKFTWRAGIDYDLTPANLVYGSVSTGFKPGGGNISSFPAVVPLQFAPETITAYEIGSKNSFFDKHLTANLSAYLYNDRNMQFQAEDLINFQGGVDNVPQVQVYGIEGEVAALMPAGLRFDGNFAWEKGKITSHFLALDNVAGLQADASYLTACDYTCYGDLFTGSPGLNALRETAYRDVYGNAPPNLPEWTVTGALTHTLNLADGSTFVSRFQLQYRSDYSDTIFGMTPIYRAPSYTMANLYFDYAYKSSGLDVSLGINNVFDRFEVASRFTNQFGGETTQVWAPPLEFVVTAHYTF
ncbi:MAG TPA: TonB-dependent receptor [Steroidobacteraceae bacterium]|nr:TonB-dependent receptor [Steroidobacteraceae bacterium]